MITSDRVNILHLTPGLALGGAERMLLALVKGLDKEKYNIKVCCWRGKRELKKAVEEAGAEVIDLEEESGNILKVSFKLLKVIKNNNIQLIHSYLFDADLCALLAGKFNRVPVIVSTVPSFTFLRSKKHQLRYKILSLFFDTFIPISEAIAKHMIKRCRIKPAKLMVVHPGFLDKFSGQQDEGEIYELRKKINLTENDIVIGTVARLDPRKGYNYLLESAAHVSKIYPRARFIFAGVGELRPELDRLVKKLGISEKVIFVGNVKSIPGFLGLLDIFVLPSLDEGFGIVILEAMTAGLPVVASRVGGIPEIVNENETGFLVEPANSEALAQAIIKLIDDKELRVRMGDLAKAKVKKFSSKEMTKKIEKVYDFYIGKKLNKGC
jgi:glycosyltransferase involved in cell wall biosynthesis